MSDLMTIAKSIRDAAEELEHEMECVTNKTRRRAELQLAWHALLDAHGLIMSGRITPDDVVWGVGEAKNICDSR